MPQSVRSVRILLTAHEAYPALEKAFLSARSEIWASFLVFDLSTKLRSPEGLAIGKTWFDLMVHVLNNGVRVNFVLSDVDPIARAQMHREATRSQRMFSAAAAVAKPGAKLTVDLARHPAQTGAMIRVMIWPYIMKKLFGLARWLNAQRPDIRANALRDMGGARQNLIVRADGTVQVRMRALPQLSPAIHHQKLAVIDREILYIGGLDLNERRYDTPNHTRVGAETWHDLQLLIEGPAVAEAQQHLETFRDVVAGNLPAPKTRRLLRTLSRPGKLAACSFGPTPLISDFAIAHRVLTQRARHLLYFESQYFRDVGLAKTLAKAARDTPGLTMILILPAAPDDVAFGQRRSLDARYGEARQSRALRIIREAFGPRLFVGSPAQPRQALPDGETTPEAARSRMHGAHIVYVHAKVSIFDRDGAIVSSANLNSRSFRWDTEAGVYLTSENDVSELRHRVMAHWLPDDAADEAFDDTRAVQVWTALARRNASLPPAQRKGYLLPHDFAAAEAFGVNLPLLPEEFV